MTTETQAPDPGSVRATGLPADAEPMRSRPERFKPNDGGTWIDDDDFGFDAMLKVDGDFGSDADRLAYAQFICDKLNAPEAIPAPEGAQVTDDMRSAVRWAPSSAYWSERLREFFGPDAREGIDALERQLRAGC